MPEETKPTDEQFVAAAQRAYDDEGTIEVDDLSTPMPTGRVSRCEDGAYVLAWVWVQNDLANAISKSG